MPEPDTPTISRIRPRPPRVVLLAVVTLCSIAPGTAWARPSAIIQGAIPPAEGLAPPAQGSETQPAPPSPGAGGEGETRSPQGPVRRDLRGACRIELEASASRVSAEETVQLSGALDCREAALADGQTVTVMEHEAGTHGFAVVGTATTEVAGAYRFTTAALQATSAFFVRVAGARSARVPIRVQPRVTISGSVAEGSQLAPATGRRRGRTPAGAVTFTGTVSPVEPGALVVLQREDLGAGDSWRRIGMGEIAPDGSYSITHAFAIPGQMNIRAVVHRQRGLAGASEPLSYEVARRQNPRLTINTSAEPIASGQTVDISGFASGPARRTVTLLGRVPGGRFAVLARTASDSAGDYEFTSQSPLATTIYRVVDSTALSTALVEGVRFTLSALAPPQSIQAGQPLTFAGTVAPAHPGEPVYLEHQGASGIGYRVLEEGTVSADGTFSISHTFYGAADELLRIKVPGNGQNEAAAGTLFKVHVAPALSGASPEDPAAGATAHG